MTSSQILALGTRAFPRLIHASDNGKYYAIAAGQTGAAASILVTEDSLESINLPAPGLPAVIAVNPDATGMTNVPIPVPMALTAPPVQGGGFSVIGCDIAGFNGNYSPTGTYYGGKQYFDNDADTEFLAEWEPITSAWQLSGTDGVYQGVGDTEFPFQATAWAVVSGVATGTPILTDLNAGTAATAVGQLAIVTTTNASGTFRDVWVCTNLSPVAWQPPGNITRDRATALYQRQFFDGGSPVTELAYP